MKKIFARQRRPVLLCSLCGTEICPGDPYWYLNGCSVCESCLTDFARQELASFQLIRGKEMSL